MTTATIASPEQRPGNATYLITVRCYGTFLHGEPGAVDRRHNLVDGPCVPESARLRRLSRRAMNDQPFVMDRETRAEVVRAIRDCCRMRGWSLWAIHVRTNHWHAVVSVDRKVEQVMRAFKSNATRALDRTEGCRRARWARHGSTRYLWTPVQVENAVRYVIAGQGEPMGLWVNPEW